MGANDWPETVIIWGAGATKHAGLLTTQDIAKSLDHIFEEYDSNYELDFLKIFPANNIATPLQNGFKLLIKNLSSKDDLKSDYDLEALQLIVKSSSKLFDISSGTQTFSDLQDLFTLMDQLIDNNFGLEVLNKNGKYFLNTQRIVAARNCLKILTEELQRIAVQGATPGKMSRAEFYHDLAATLAGLMTKEAFEFQSKGFAFDSRSFYLYSYAIISFNWDPLILWAIFNAHKDRNDLPPMMNGCLPLRLFNDLGTVIATRKVDSNGNEIWYTANETQCIRINDPMYPSRIMRVGKILYPHGIFGSRLCPQCGKLITSFGHKWEKESSLPFGPSLIKELQSEWKYNEEEIKEKKEGIIKCLFCGQTTHPYDIPLEMQTVIKKRAIAPIDEIKKEMGLLIKHTKHIVFAGYSLPRDDISEKLFFVSSLSGQNIKEKACTVIQFDPEYDPTGPDWLNGREILNYLNNKEISNSEISTSIKNILSIFDLDQTRLTLKGIPNIFLSYKNIELAVLDIFYRGEFPPDRSRNNSEN